MLALDSGAFFSPYEFNTKPVTNMDMMPREIPVADIVSPNNAAKTAE